MSNRIHLKLRFLKALALCLLVFPPASFSQINTGTVVGTVYDPDGGVVPAADVTLRRPLTGEVYRTKTNQAGDYRSDSVPVGEYELAVSTPGFKLFQQRGIQLETGRTIRLDASLQVGDTNETVEAVANDLLLDSENSAISHIVSGRTLANFPMGQRDFTYLALLNPGVAPRRRGDAQDARGYMFVRGRRETENNLFLDGSLLSIANGTIDFKPNPDALQEFEVKTGLYGAQFGIRPGGQMSAVIKSGTNELHGVAFWLLRNDQLDARPYFAATRTEFKRNQAGVTAGGPIYLPKLFNGKDRLWFFASFAQESIRRFVPLTNVVPTTNQRGGVFSTSIRDPLSGSPFPNNTIPVNRLDRVSQQLISFWPEPNSTGGLNFVSPNSTFAFDSPEVITKVDIRQNDQSRWFASFLYNSVPIIQTTVIPAFSNEEPLTGWVGSVSNTRTWSGRAVNTASVHIFHRPYMTGPSNPKPEAARALGVPDLLRSAVDQSGIPTISIVGFAGIGDRASMGPVNIGNFQVKDELSVQLGSHTLASGIEFRRHYAFLARQTRSSFSFANRYTGNAWGDFLLGHPITSVFGGEGQRGRMYQDSVYTFLQDDWKVSPKLTINLGLRHELRLGWKDRRGFMTNFNTVTGQLDPAETSVPLQPWETGRFPTNTPLIRFSRRTFLPRVGFAYRLASDTVLRGGFGIYANEPDVTVLYRLAANPRSNAQRLTYLSPVSSPVLSLSNPFPANLAQTAVPAIAGFERSLPAMATHQWGLSVQRLLGDQLLVDVGYQASRSTNQIDVVQLNDAAPGPGNRQSRRPYPNLQAVQFMMADGDAWYNSLEAKIVRRAGRDGLQLQAAVTLAKAIDTAGGGISMPGEIHGRSRNIDTKANKALSESHTGRRIALTAAYEFPFGKGRPYLNSGPLSHVLGGWTLQSIAVFQTGPWFTVFVPGDAYDAGSTLSQWPDRLRNPNLPSDQRNPTRWFDTTAFARPTEPRYGNAGRSIVQAPGLNNLDLSLHRRFPVTDTLRIELRAESFNLTNTTNFRVPGNNFGTANFGVLGNAWDNRQMQIGLRIVY